MIAIQFFPQLQQVGVDALAGFTSALINTRYFGPIMVGIGLSATIGAGATAQLGAMRISEEIDALEAMSIRAVIYLCSTRLVAGIVVVMPLFAVAVLLAYFATQLLTTIDLRSIERRLRPLLLHVPQSRSTCSGRCSWRSSSASW